MQRKSFYWLLLSIFCIGGVVWFLRREDGRTPQSQSPAAPVAAIAPVSPAASTQSGPVPASPVKVASATANKPADPYPYLLRNTTNSEDEMIHNDRAILLMNAQWDTGKPIDLAAIPAALRAPARNGTYIVQANGAIDDKFRAALKDAGATIVSYIPNNACLVRVADAGAQQLAASPQTQVLPYEPYYKLDPSLLKLAIEQPQALPPQGGLNLTLFADQASATIAQLQSLGASVQSQENSPFGPLVKVYVKPGTLESIASLPGVEGVTTWHTRKLANDLSRPETGVAVDTVTNVNWLGLTGTNVLVGVVEFGIDAAHPDLVNRIWGDPTASFTDQVGHGTHVVGSILGSGTESSTVTNAQGSVSNANFRGMAPDAYAYEVNINNSDQYIQETQAQTNVLISNNSWTYGNQQYDIFAASYDAAVRDSLPHVPGSQPLLFVFAAGNSGAGYTDGTGGFSDTIESPATAKNVITVGAVEEPRYITNAWEVDGVTNTFYDGTDTSDQVAWFSSRGNVGINVEGGTGRFKPDVVAPGVMSISCRSEQWDTNTYYSDTYYSYSVLAGNVVGTNNSFTPFDYILPQGAIAMSITLVTNAASKGGVLPVMPIYVADNAFPTDSGTPTGNNSVTLPTGSIQIGSGDTIFFDVGNTTNYIVNFDVKIVVTYTNDVGNYESVLQQLNDSLGTGNYYRYESGTSMAAAKVSGILTLMQDYLQTHTNLLQSYPPSPALMKAMLINGSRSVSDQYHFAPNSSANPNAQGWGEPNLTDILPGDLTNAESVPALILVDQSPTNALATGQSATRVVNLTANGTSNDLRVTLVWTDPPGNPIAGVKLVNDLDLIVSNEVTGEVYYGNDFRSDIPYNNANTTNAPAPDSVNNVENVYIQGPLSSGVFDVTVFGRRVNVNAVTANNNNVVQDYALVISSGDGLTSSNAFQSITGTPTATVVPNNYITNFFVLSNGVPVFNQRVGANSQYASDALGDPGTPGATNQWTNGVAAQWNFYVFTNTAGQTNGSFTNVAFVTFSPPNLGLPVTGALGEVSPPDVNATRYLGADLDMYVSYDPSITNLNPAAINSAFKSVGRTGNETVYRINDAPGLVYYLAIKSEDQQAAQYSLVAFATDMPFSQGDGNGNEKVFMNPVLTSTLSGGTPSNPATNYFIGICVDDLKVRNTVDTMQITCQDFGDYIGALSEGTNTVILNNHNLFDNTSDASETFIYDDSGENNFAGSRHSSGPGTLRGFTGQSALGTTWFYTIVNDGSISDTGTLNSMYLTLQPQPATNRFSELINGLSWFYDYVDVPANATNMTISILNNSTPALPLDLVIGNDYYPTLTTYDEYALIGGTGGSLSVNKYSDPPLNAGRYFFGIFNPNITAQNVTITIEVDQSLAPVQAVNYVSPGNEPILDDAVTYSTNHVKGSGPVVSAEVGVRIDHPRESDLVLTLVSPSGTRVLLAENRGGLDTNGYGHGIDITNVFPAASSGGIAENVNNIALTTNFGTLIVDYNMYTVPDDLRIYYDGVRIFDTGLVSGSSEVSVNFGPGFSTNITIIMNEAGTNPYGTNGDKWDYTATVVTRETTYATFTENTNLTTTPIKFAVPPFGSGLAFIPPATNFYSDFETTAPGDYSALSIPSTVDGWTLTSTNPVSVVTGTNIANTGTNLLALHGGTITRTVTNLVPGYNYTFRFANRALPTPMPVGWWKGDGNAHDYIYGNDGVMSNGFYTNGIVNQAFSFDYRPFLPTPTYVGVQIPDSTNYWITNSITIEGWIRPRTNNYSYVIFGRGDSGPYDPFVLTMDNSLFMSFLISDGTGAAPAQVFTALPSYDQWYHVAAVLDGTNGNMSIYVNGAIASQTNTTVRPFGDFQTDAIPGTHPGVGIGNFNDGSGGFGSAPFIGDVDEITLYSNALTAAQIGAIYDRGPLGKTLANATLTYGGTTNTITGTAGWTTNFYTFTAPSNTMTFTIYPNANPDGTLQDGTLLDSIALIQDAEPNSTNYYLPEESLQKIVGENSQGDWVLEVLDNRAGPNPTNWLVSWQLSLVLGDTQPGAIPLTAFIPQTNVVAPQGWTYYQVTAPTWAAFATNILSNASGPLNFWYNQGVLPTGTNTLPPDYELLTGVNSGTGVLTTNGAAPLLLPGSTYYLGVQNPGTSPVSFQIEVDFDLTTLTNLVPLTNQTIATGSAPRYFQFNAPSNSILEEFRVFNSTGNLELVANYGAPLPTEINYQYIGAYSGSNNQTIIILTNSLPVPATNGTWYVGVFNNDFTNVNYTIEAIAIGTNNIIDLTNGIPYTSGVSSPGLPLTNFFRFTITNTAAAAALFELYQKTGDVDLSLDSNTIPYGPPYFVPLQNIGTNFEQIVIRTNFTTGADGYVSNLTGFSWYLGVPDLDSSNVNFTIRASYSTNSTLMSVNPFNVTANPTTNGLNISWTSVYGNCYQIQASPDLVTWTNLTSIISGGPGEMSSYTDTNAIPGSPSVFYQVLQVDCP
jgi:subtilisin-like proprotein convertase family protein